MKIALMSIHPIYANAILGGTKLVEFRKRPLASDVTHVLLYSTHPERKILGGFKLLSQEVSSPHSLWDRFKGVSGISREGFFKYYAGKDIAVGIRVGELIKFREPQDLKEMLGIDRPPQSFQYLPPEISYEIFDKLTSCA